MTTKQWQNSLSREIFRPSSNYATMTRECSAFVEASHHVEVSEVRSAVLRKGSYIASGKSSFTLTTTVWKGGQIQVTEKVFSTLAQVVKSLS
jgi:hypothetical protein